jgi:hypothetical protein
LNQALKEWAIAVDVLTQGETIVLLRKGGIRESGGKFAVEHDRVLLYPTYEHQKPELLKDGYADRVRPVPSGWHPQQVEINALAQITHIFQVTAADRVAALQPFHIWNDRFVTERLKWKSKSPLYVLLLRVSRLADMRSIDYREEYGGCRSWIDLADQFALESAVPVLEDAQYKARVDEICGVLASC